MAMTVFKGENFTGDSTQIGGEVTALTDGFNDNVNSIKVTEGTWIIYQHFDFQGGHSIIGPGWYKNQAAFRLAGNIVSSMCPLPSPSPSSIVLFQDYDFRGRMVELRGPQQSFFQLHFNDKVSSAIVISGKWLLYEHTNYGGSTQLLPVGNYHDIGANDRASSAQPV